VNQFGGLKGEKNQIQQAQGITSEYQQKTENGQHSILRDTFS